MDSEKQMGIEKRGQKNQKKKKIDNKQKQAKSMENS